HVRVTAGCAGGSAEKSAGKEGPGAVAPGSASEDRKAEAQVSVSQGRGPGSRHCFDRSPREEGRGASRLPRPLPRLPAAKGDDARLRGIEGETATAIRALGRGGGVELAPRLLSLSQSPTSRRAALKRAELTLLSVRITLSSAHFRVSPPA